MRRAIWRALAAFAIGTSAALALPMLASRAMAQDFASPTPAGPAASPGAFLERALPPCGQRGAPVPATLEVIAIAWDPGAELTTRALAGVASWRGIACGAGVSSTGDQFIGWNSLALAFGRSGATNGAGVRALLRRDRAPDDATGARAAGAEAGAGFWSALGSRARIWASAPMAFTVGEPPPLDRGLETGISVAFESFSAWGAWSAPAGAVDAGERTFGAACESGALALWAEARDRPLRASIALRVRRGALTVCAQVLEHPALGETARLSLSVGGAAR